MIDALDIVLVVSRNAQELMPSTMPPPYMRVFLSCCVSTYMIKPDIKLSSFPAPPIITRPKYYSNISD